MPFRRRRDRPDPAQPLTPAAPAPSTTADGQWWWDGYRWVPFPAHDYLRWFLRSSAVATVLTITLVIWWLFEILVVVAVHNSQCQDPNYFPKVNCLAPSPASQ